MSHLQQSPLVGVGFKPKPLPHHLLFLHDIIGCNTVRCVHIYVCVCVCVPSGHRSHVVQQQQQQRTAPDWIKVLLGCGRAPFGKSGFGFEIEAQEEALCHPQGRDRMGDEQLKDEEEEAGIGRGQREWQQKNS